MKTLSEPSAAVCGATMAGTVNCSPGQVLPLASEQS